MWSLPVGCVALQGDGYQRDLVQNVRILGVSIIGDSYLGTYTRASASLSCLVISDGDAEEMAVLREHFFGSPQPRPPRRERDPSLTALEPLCLP